MSEPLNVIPPDLTYVHDLDEAALRALQRTAAERHGVAVHFADRLRDGTPGPALAVIPAGLFEMGAAEGEFGARPEEYPQHYVGIGRDFAIGRYTITTAQFDRFREETGWPLRPDLIWARGDEPVINIRYRDALLFAEWLSDHTGQTYRLPTEAEWEYACRAGSLTPFHYGEDVSCKEVHFDPTFPWKELKEKRRWFLPRCFPMSRALPVGSKPPNLWGLYDMHGNVWEMTSSPWTLSHANNRRDGGRNDSRSRWIVTKGGSWFDPAASARSAARFPRLRDELDVNLGFRLVRELD